jgi:sialate O-acetylesterase
MKRNQTGANRSAAWQLLACAAALAATPQIAFAQGGGSAAESAMPLVHPLFASHAVLQRNKPIPFWGWARAGASVVVSFGGASQTVRADAGGKWRAEFPERAAGTGLRLEVREEAGRTASSDDLSIGDVFLCTGQSNMVHPMYRALNPMRELDRPEDKNIRLFQVPLTGAAGPQALTPKGAAWAVATVKTVPNFSAVCMFFGRNVTNEKKLPVGLVFSAWGGTHIETWIGAEGLRKVGGYEQELDLLDVFNRNEAEGYALAGKQWEEWWLGRTPKERPWERPAAQVAALPAVPLLADWREFDDPAMKSYVGMVWFYRTIELSADQAAKARRIGFGTVGEIASVWVNGKFLGASAGGSSAGDEKGNYTLPAGMLKPGANVVAIAAYNSNLNVRAGLLGPAHDMRLSVEGSEPIALDKGWRYARVTQRGSPPRLPWEGRAGFTSAYNGMIAPLGDLPLAGVLWDQGGSNAVRAGEYKPLLKMLISEWRRQLRAAELPFVIIQLTGVGGMTSEAEDDSWSRIREVQRQVALEDPRAALVVTVDTQDRFDSHAAQRKAIGARAWQAARKVVYGEDVATSGPVPLKAELSGNNVVIPFGGLSGKLIAAAAGRPYPFMICAPDGKRCAFADAQLAGNTVTVEVPAGIEPAMVRYCWSRVPICNLFDAAGAQDPAGPFELKITPRKGTQ